MAGNHLYRLTFEVYQAAVDSKALSHVLDGFVHSIVPPSLVVTSWMISNNPRKKAPSAVLTIIKHIYHFPFSLPSPKPVPHCVLLKGLPMEVFQEINKQLWTYAQEGDVEGVRDLIHNGGDVNSKYEHDDSLAFPLFAAIKGNHAQVTKLLLQHGADPNALTKGNATPLHYAIYTRQMEIVKLLLENGADPDALTYNKWNPLHFAAKKEHVDMALLLAEWGANPNAKNENGATAMDYAYNSRIRENFASLLRPFTCTKQAMKSKKRECVQGFLRQSIIQKDVSEMKARFHKVGKGIHSTRSSEWKDTLRQVNHDHLVEMIYFAFETENADKRNDILEWIGNEKWIQKVKFSDGSTLMERAAAFRHRTAVERMLFYGMDPYEGNQDNQLMPLICQTMIKMPVDEMIVGYTNIKNAADALEENERRRTLMRIMHDHKVETLYCAFETNDTDKRNAVIKWIDDNDWIQSATYENGPTLMQRAVHSKNLAALERMICFRLDPFKGINNQQQRPESVGRKKLKNETRDKAAEIMRRRYADTFQKLIEMHGVSVIDKAELIDSALFFSTSMHQVVLTIDIAINRLQPEEIKPFIIKGLTMATDRCFVYEDSDRKLFIKLVVELGRRNLLTEDEKLDFQSKAITVNTENTDWVKGIKASIRKLDARLTATERGLVTLQNNFNALVAALEDREERREAKEKIQLAISLTCSALALFGGPFIKELVETVVFINDPGLILEAIRETTEGITEEFVIKEGVKSVLEEASIPPDSFVAKLREATARLKTENEDGYTTEGAKEDGTCSDTADILSLDKSKVKQHESTDKESELDDSSSQDDHSDRENKSSENTETNRDHAKASRKVNRLSLADVVKMIQKQQKEKKEREAGNNQLGSDNSVSPVAAMKPTFVDLFNVSKEEFRAHPLHYAVHASDGDLDIFVRWAKSILVTNLSINDTMNLRVRDDHLSTAWEEKDCSALMLASYMGCISIVDWFIDQGNVYDVETPFLIRCRAQDVAEVFKAA